MLISLPVPPREWDSNNARDLKLFLESETGRLAVQWLFHLGPSLLDGADVNKTLVASGEVKGYASAIQTLLGLQIEQPKSAPQPTNYPSLDDDQAWSAESNTRPE